MSLRRENKILNAIMEARGYDVLNEGTIGIGDDFENELIRVHRFASSIRVTDLTNAGKRGKTVDYFALYNLDFVKDEKIRNLIDKFLVYLQRNANYAKVKAMADGIVQEGQRLYKTGRLKGLGPKIEVMRAKGVDIAPGGFKEIKIDTPDLVGYAGSEGFRVMERNDPNETTIIAPSRGAKTAIKNFYKWVMANDREIRSMTFSDVLRSLKKEGIDYHQYCAMD